jgi:hypothetical protein
MSENDIRALGFELYQRDHPNTKKIGSFWRNSPEYEAWMKLYTDPANTTLMYHEEENHQIGTFYRALDAIELRKQEEVATVNDAPQADAPKNPQYQVLDVVHEHGTDGDVTEHRVWHVKLGRPRWAPVGERFGLIEYVLVDQFRRVVSDDEGTFTYVVTKVVVSDEDQDTYDEAEPVYLAPAFLNVDECMFAIGEYPLIIQEEN